MQIKTVSIIGLGALGIMFGHHLQKKMPYNQLRIIADKERIEKYKKDEIYCNGEPCNFNFMEPKENCTPADLVIFTVKYQGLIEAIKAVKNQIGDKTIILSALNGIISEEIIADTYGMDKILYCVAQGMDALKVGNSLTYEHMGMLSFGVGEKGIISEKVKSVSQFFTEMDFPFEAVDDMKHRLWGKFMLNVGVNQTVAVFACNFKEIQKEGKAREIMILAMKEVMTLSKMEGIPLTDNDLQYWLDILSTLNPDGKPSMAQDVEAKRYSEVELFAGTVITLGKKYGIPTPVNQLLYDKMKEIECAY